MSEEKHWTRRNVLRTSGVIAGVSAMAGCIGDTGNGGNNGNGNGTGSGGSPGSLSMPPVGAVEFDGVPETWVANNGSWADMGVALGLEPPKAVWLANRYHTHYYDDVDGVSVDGSDVASLYQNGGVSFERFLQLDADVHVMDPNFLQNRFSGWTDEDVADLESRV